MHTNHIASRDPAYGFYPITLRISTDKPSAHPLDARSLMVPGASGAGHNSEQLQ